ncbi:PaaI family thioesterase [Gordonia hongkongensis]|uniref:PaaI family thioesterase n=1 Tax=Gordonia hongkongensis TaxID=1701090 RepID=UPI003D762293
MITSARHARTLMNIWPPFSFSGIHIDTIFDDWTFVRVRMHVRRWNGNMNGKAFGGSLFSMTDPFFALMALGQLGEAYFAANTRAEIEFIRPGRRVMFCEMRLPADVAAAIGATARTQGHSTTEHTAEIYCESGDIVARCTQTLHVSPRRATTR